MRKTLEEKISTIFPKMNNITSSRIDELKLMKEKIRTNPEDVDQWFDKEIERLNQVSMSELMQSAIKLFYQK